MSTTTTEKRIPEVKGLPLVGSAAEMMRDPCAFLVRGYLEHGPVFRVTVVNRRTTVLAGPELARWMGSREGQSALRTRETWSPILAEYGAKRTITALDGPDHKRLREVLRRGYSREALHGRLDRLVEITDRVLDEDWRPGTRVPVVFSMQVLAATQLGTLLTGEPPAGYVRDIRTAIGGMLNALVLRQRPKIILWDPRYKRARARLMELGEQMVRDHRARGPVPEADRTLIDDIVETHDRDPELIAREDLVNLVTGPYVAGLDTAANTMSTVLHCVLEHPEVLARIRAEADAVFARDGELTEDALDDLPSVSRAIDETLRLYPITVLQPRHAARDFTYAGYRIREGEPVYCAVSVPHFLPEFFPDPQVFDIDRYSPERREHTAPGAYAPFGKGPHTCLGKGIADIQMTLTIARMFHRLDLRLDPPGHVMRRSNAPSPSPGHGFRLRVAGLRVPARDARPTTG